MTPFALSLSLPNRSKINYPFGRPPEGVDALWRVEARSYSYVIDAEAEEYGTTSPVLEMYWFRVKRWTKCGARLDWGKYVNLDKNISRREWASRTEAEALASFKARRARQIAILEGQADRARRELALTEGLSL
ncbi:hypothetical protein [Agrobacterium tumefaciens]|uniref:hypothetical protein n=1 Tax=Agrobacterium tumefaciens TaxID=358 RepID=UPI0021CF7828|nr:hypothetical protein [Agrobacterium tumefaciens]UXS23114.1 hypothetical protein FY153_01105 [Agrobacterium tumefaciens]